MNDQISPEAIAKTLGVTAKGGRRTAWLRRYGLWGGGGLIALLLIWWLFFTGGTPLAYVTDAAQAQPLTVTVSATGTLRPLDQIEVGAEISGRIEEVTVDFNDRVSAGQLLARLDTAQLEARLAQSRAQLASAEAQVKQAGATVAESRSRRNRVADLRRTRNVSEQELETAEAALARAVAARDIAAAQVALAAAQVQSDETNLARAYVHAPIDGIVLDRRIEPGQTVAAQMQTPVLFVIASNLDAMELHVDIDEADIGQVAEGQKAVFTVDAFPNRRFTAEIVSIRNAPKTVQGVVTYEGVLRVANEGGLLRPGMTATADITVATIDEALTIANAALRFEPPPRAKPAGLEALPPVDDQDRPLGRVWRQTGETLEPVTVTLGATDGTRTQVIEGAIAAGDMLVTDINTGAAP